MEIEAPTLMEMDRETTEKCRTAKRNRRTEGGGGVKRWHQKVFTGPTSVAKHHAY